MPSRALIRLSVLHAVFILSDSLVHREGYLVRLLLNHSAILIDVALIVSLAAAYQIPFGLLEAPNL